MGIEFLFLIDFIILFFQPHRWKLFGSIEKDYPVAEYIDNNGFYIGCHHGMDKEELDYIIEKISEFIENNSNNG